VDLYYFDTSALVKRYVAEPGTHWVSQICRSHTVAISTLTTVELTSTLTRRLHAGLTNPQQYQQSGRRFLIDGPTYVSLGLTTAIVDRAAQIVAALPPSTVVRSLDALHLACAEEAFTIGRQSGWSVIALVSSDRRLLAAAQHLGLPTDNPENYP
jgi:predicted nucleic acid-binding protein